VPRRVTEDGSTVSDASAAFIFTSSAKDYSVGFVLCLVCRARRASFFSERTLADSDVSVGYFSNVASKHGRKSVSRDLQRCRPSLSKCYTSFVRRVRIHRSVITAAIVLLTCRGWADTVTLRVVDADGKSVPGATVARLVGGAFI
jgi:hypothetical protein